MDEGGNEERLPTFKAPRDLTLTKSGISLPGLRPKKVYAPNIPARRVRDDKPEPSTSAQHTKLQPKVPVKEDRRKIRKEAIQSSSIFQEGAGDGTMTKKHSYPSISRGRSGGDGGEEYSRPTKSFNPIMIKKEPVEETDKMDLKIPDEDYEQLMTAPITFGPFDPVTLPLRSYVECMSNVTEGQPKLASEFQPGSFSHLWASAPKEGTKVLIQLPDHLPVLEQESVETNESKLSKDIRSFPEGFIGTIQIMSSGRSRLVLGENYFDITPGATTVFPQEVAVIDVEEKQFTALGSLEKKFICIPDIEALLSEVKINE